VTEFELQVLIVVNVTC